MCLWLFVCWFVCLSFSRWVGVMVHTTTLSSHSQAYGALFPHPTRLRVKEPDGLMLVLRSSAPNTQVCVTVSVSVYACESEYLSVCV